MHSSSGEVAEWVPTTVQSPGILPCALEIPIAMEIKMFSPLKYQGVADKGLFHGESGKIPVFCGINIRILT